MHGQRYIINLGTIADKCTDLSQTKRYIHRLFFPNMCKLHGDKPEQKRAEKDNSVWLLCTSLSLTICRRNNKRLF